jgi:hypothetical protein
MNKKLVDRETYKDKLKSTFSVLPKKLKDKIDSFIGDLNE